MSNQKKTPRWVPKLYRNSPKLTKDRFVRYIHDFEARKGRPVLWDRAEDIFRILKEQSREAEKAGDRDSIWIVFDPVTGEWGGYKTPDKREAYDIERKSSRGQQSQNSYRNRFGKILPCSKQELFKEIIAIQGCSIDLAKQIWESGRHNAFRHDKATNTWRGWYADPPTLSDAVKAPPGPKQEEYLKRYGCMPELLHDYSNGGVNSDVLKWIVARHLELGETIDIAEAGKHYRRAWGCGKSPFAKDEETKLVRGVNYGSKTRVFRMMPEMREDNPAFDTFLEEHASRDMETAVSIWLDAIKCGDLIKLHGDEDGLLTCVGADVVRSNESAEEAEENDDCGDSEEDSENSDDESGEDESDESYSGEPRKLEDWEILMAEEEARERARTTVSTGSHFEEMRAMLG